MPKRTQSIHLSIHPPLSLLTDSIFPSYSEAFFLLIKMSLISVKDFTKTLTRSGNSGLILGVHPSRARFPISVQKIFKRWWKKYMFSAPYFCNTSNMNGSGRLPYGTFPYWNIFQIYVRHNLNSYCSQRLHVHVKKLWFLNNYVQYLAVRKLISKRRALSKIWLNL